MAQNLSNFDASLKEFYKPAFREQLNNSHELLSRLERKTEDFVGKKWIFDLHYSRNSGVGSRADGGTLPTAGNQGYMQAYGAAAYHYGRIKITGPTIKASRNNKGAFVKAVDSEMKHAVNDLKRELNYQLFNDGTGTRCLVNGDPGTGTTLTVDTPGVKYLYDGMKITIQDPSSGVACTSSDGLTITSIDTANNTCTMSAAINADVATNDRVVAYGNTDGAGVAATDCYEMMGLKGIIDDGTELDTLHGVSRSSYDWWKCSTHSDDDNSGTNRDLTTDLMQASIDAVEDNGGNVDLIITGRPVRRKYMGLLTGDKRYVNTMKADGGVTSISFDDIPIMVDRFCPPNTIFFVDTSHLFLEELSDWDWMDEDGAILSRVSGEDAYEAVFYRYVELATDRPRAFSFLRDISE